ncbi:hypothetical protein [Thomasclavelia cocleata]|uniref:Leucine Rich repeat-containing protein n=2 Tax=Thomasclavelia cocleata TaxID=69824 RepID=A0A829ZCT0_9FIRM|nr:hypothetical protein [Thomasclavelia cocleata]GFI41802.1 hypothetical protein IMSAGC017_01847 [Thomasclavelia cocleata]
MGAWIIKDFIEISDKTRKGTILECFSYKEIDETFICDIIEDNKIKTIQISKTLPAEAYQIIDSILERKPQLNFRVYNLYFYNQYDISFLEKMSHLRSLRIDCHLRDWNNMIDFNILTKLNLKSLYLNAFELKDYTFIKNLSKNLEELLIYADTMGSSIYFDCKWLLQYKKMHTLWLGKKAKKNIECLSEMKSLKSLSLRGIKLLSFDFLRDLNLEKLELLWNSNNDLKELKELKTLKQIGLWRINKLDNIDFVSELKNLEVIKLQDLKHITKLPDLSRLSNLKILVLDNTGISIDDIEEPYKSKVKKYWR